MSLTATFRVRVWRAVDLRPVSGADPVTAAQDAVAGNPSLAATVETDGGDGPVLVVAVAGYEFPTDHLGRPFDSAGLVVRRWEVDQAYEETGAMDSPGLLLGEFREVLLEMGVEGVRLLTAEDNDDDGSPIIEAAAWFDSAEDGWDEDGWDEDDEDDDRATDGHG